MFENMVRGMIGLAIQCYRIVCFIASRMIVMTYTAE